MGAFLEKPLSYVKEDSKVISVRTAERFLEKQYLKESLEELQGETVRGT